jgi:predicted metal-dependent HD superfamily phosphohydrolase
MPQKVYQQGKESPNMNNRYHQIVDNLMNRSTDFYRATGLLYHSRQHIKSMLNKVEDHFTDLVVKDQLDLLNLAIAYHDVVYVPGAVKGLGVSHVNEEMSALVFFNEYKDITTEEERGILDYEAVMELIRATWWENHISYSYKPQSCIESILLDVDLESLADPWEDFVANQKDIIGEQIGRRETVTTEHFQMSSAFLKKFTERAFIYRTDRARQLWESKARANIHRLINAYPPLSLE